MSNEYSNKEIINISLSSKIKKDYPDDYESYIEITKSIVDKLSARFLVQYNQKYLIQNLGSLSEAKHYEVDPCNGIFEFIMSMLRLHHDMKINKDSYFKIDNNTEIKNAQYKDIIKRIRPKVKALSGAVEKIEDNLSNLLESMEAINSTNYLGLTLNEEQLCNELRNIKQIIYRVNKVSFKTNKPMELKDSSYWLCKQAINHLEYLNMQIPEYFNEIIKIFCDTYPVDYEEIRNRYNVQVIKKERQKAINQKEEREIAKLTWQRDLGLLD